jgi:hypothetical protein
VNILKQIVIVVALFLGIQAHGFDFLTSSLNGGTNAVAAASTNSVTTPTFTVAYSSDIALQPSFKLQGSGTSAVVFKFDTSLDGTVWQAASFNISITPAGTALVTKVVSTAIGSTPYVRLSSIENPNATAITNLMLNATMKRGL